MEVHHHPHIPTHAKPWKEYLLEGLMIFVAVTLGYGAENVREHYVETKKAIISAKNLYVDVTYDSIGYAGVKETEIGKTAVLKSSILIITTTILTKKYQLFMPRMDICH